MSKFQKFSLRHISNGAGVQDGFDVYAIREGGTEVWAATSGENLSQLQVEIPDAEVEKAAKQAEFERAIKPAEDDLVHTVGTAMINKDEVYDPKKLAWVKDHIYFTEDMTDQQTIDYLWDVVKSLHIIQIPGVKS